MAALVDRSKLVEVVDDCTRAVVDILEVVREVSVLLDLKIDYYDLMAA